MQRTAYGFAYTTYLWGIYFYVCGWVRVRIPDRTRHCDIVIRISGRTVRRISGTFADFTAQSTVNAAIVNIQREVEMHVFSVSPCNDGGSFPTAGSASLRLDGRHTRICETGSVFFDVGIAEDLSDDVALIVRSSGGWSSPQWHNVSFTAMRMLAFFVSFRMEGFLAYSFSRFECIVWISAYVPRLFVYKCWMDPQCHS